MAEGGKRKGQAWGEKEKKKRKTLYAGLEEGKKGGGWRPRPMSYFILRKKEGFQGERGTKPFFPYAKKKKKKKKFGAVIMKKEKTGEERKGPS